MIQFKDFTAPVSEKKSRRKELCMKPSVAEKIKRAAGMTGMDESTFIASAAYQKAHEVERSHLTTVLDEAHFVAFATAIDAVGKRNAVLAAAIEKSRTMFRDA